MKATKGVCARRPSPVAWLALLLPLLLAGCAGTPPAPVPAAPEVTAPPAAPHAVAAFEATQQRRAQAHEREGRLAEAAWGWELLTVLCPDKPEYRAALAQVKAQIETAADERMQRAQALRKRGELEAAATQYLQLLALQPAEPAQQQAAEALRALERERNRRLQLARAPRPALVLAAQLQARRMPPAEPAPAAKRPASAAAAATTTLDRNELEHASMLATQGELDEAIALLERRIPADPRDQGARRQLAELYVQKAEKLAAARPPQRLAAIGWLQRSLKLDAAQPRAPGLLKQLLAEAAAR